MNTIQEKYTLLLEDIFTDYMSIYSDIKEISLDFWNTSLISEYEMLNIELNEENVEYYYLFIEIETITSSKFDIDFVYDTESCELKISTDYTQNNCDEANYLSYNDIVEDLKEEIRNLYVKYLKAEFNILINSSNKKMEEFNLPDTKNIIVGCHWC